MATSEETPVMEMKIKDTPVINVGSTNVPLTPIQSFYKDSTVFITGGTGFLGKVLIEKLLRNTDVKTIYVLVRQKKGKGAVQRVVELMDDVVFQRVKREVPNCHKKIQPIIGDCAVTGLGLNMDSVKLLRVEVDIVFHVAATVRFDEKLKLAIAINVHGARDVLDLCRQMEKLKSVIHVSTAYSNCHLNKIDEKFYQYPFNYDDFPHILEKLDDRAIDQITPKLLGKWPNTYSLTKAMAEAMILDRHSGLPLGVFRPAIVVSTYKEPIRGWIDNYYGPTGVCAAAMTGVLKTMHCDGEINANIVPVDMCVNALIASAWDVCENWKNASVPPIYNYVSSVEKPITWQEFNKINIMYAPKYPLMRQVLPPDFDTHKSSLAHNINMVILQLVPAVCLDFLTLLTGNKPRMVRTYHKVWKFSKVIEPFSNTNWIFTNDNVQGMLKRLDDGDKEVFDFDMKRLDWLEYFKFYVLGIRAYLFKEDNGSIPQARKRQMKLVMSYAVLKFIFCYVAVYTFWLTLRGVGKSATSILWLRK